MNLYLIVIGILIIMLGFRNECFTNISKFTPTDIPDLNHRRSVPAPFNILPTPSGDPNVYLRDSRYIYPYNPPVNPITRQTVIKKEIPASPDLYFTQTYTTDNALIGPQPQEPTNELYYSGGLNQMIEIPLQFNEPYEPEQLRSQKVLITPYNRIKYSTEKFKNTVF